MNEKKGEGRIFLFPFTLFPFPFAYKLILNILSHFMEINIRSKSIRISTCLALMCLGFGAAAQAVNDEVIAKQKMTIQAVIRNLEKDHYSPKSIDDNFSKIIWKKYLLALDPNKNVLLQTDLQELKKYELTIDDELKQGSVDFFTAAYTIYQQRLKEDKVLYQKILEKPFDLHKKETLQLNGDLQEFPASRQALEEIWRKRLKYTVLKKMTDQGLTSEKLARQKVSKWMDNVFKNLMADAAIHEKFSLYVNTITLEMDPHTSFFGPVKARGVNEHMSKRYFGIGLELSDKEGDVVIKALRPGGSAIKSGLVEVNDQILQISDAKGIMVDISGVPIAEVADLIRGDKDSDISLSLKKSNGTEKTVSLKRTEIKEEEGRARSAIIQSADKQIGYIYLPEFYADFANADGAHCAADVEKEVTRLKALNVSGIVIDLRNNGGGSLDEVVKMTGFFIGAGPKVQIRDKQEVKIFNTWQSPLYDGPLAVMINENSASASEIFAAAIQDYKRGMIIGSSSSYGKGTAQATVPMGKMENKEKGIPALKFGSLRLTMNKFYRVSGASTQLKGVKADIILPGKYQYLKIKEKDNVTALAWDSIPATNYRLFNNPDLWDNILNLANEHIAQQEAFKVIGRNTGLLARQENEPVDLNIDKFRKQQANLLSIMKQIDQAVQLPEAQKLKVTGTSVDANQPGWYAKWLDTLSADLYIGESIGIMNNIISRTNK
jgi:carboxyl-terminal processing protease